MTLVVSPDWIGDVPTYVSMAMTAAVVLLWSAECDGELVGKDAAVMARSVLLSRLLG